MHSLITGIFFNPHFYIITQMFEIYQLIFFSSNILKRIFRILIEILLGIRAKWAGFSSVVAHHNYRIKLMAFEFIDTFYSMG
jgi:hypothetical protein